jgi:hypothetical protein
VPAPVPFSASVAMVASGSGQGGSSPALLSLWVGFHHHPQIDGILKCALGHYETMFQELVWHIYDHVVLDNLIYFSENCMTVSSCLLYIFRKMHAVAVLKMLLTTQCAGVFTSVPKILAC